MYHQWVSAAASKQVLVSASSAAAVLIGIGTNNFIRKSDDSYGNKSLVQNESLASQNRSPLLLRKRMTSIGRFSYKSETIENPSIPTFFLAFSEKDPNDVLDVKKVNQIWKDKKIMENHYRFHSAICSTDDRYFVLSNDYNNQLSPAKDFQDYAKSTFHSSLLYRTDLKQRIEKFLVDPLNVNEKLWEAQISSGVLGSSGAISKRKAEGIRANHNSNEGLSETIMLFRSHHALADGVSLASIIGQIADEADEVQALVGKMIKSYKAKSKAKRMKMTLFQKLIKSLKLFWSVVMSLIRHGILILTSSNPFSVILAHSPQPAGYRSVSWCDVCTIEEAKDLAKHIFPGSTINDLFVSCVSAAIAKQFEEHTLKLSSHSRISPMPKSFNIVVPVHLSGGILQPGESMGNRIGAFVAPLRTKFLPGSRSYSTEDNLASVSLSLKEQKYSPSAFISWYIAKFASNYLPDAVTKKLMLLANANAVCAISNVRLPLQNKLHLSGRPIESMCGFLPLPPGIPIGVVVQSYAGNISLTIAADKRVVPDADKFLSWVLIEYQNMLEAAAKKSSRT